MGTFKDSAGHSFFMKNEIVLYFCFLLFVSKLQSFS